MFPYAVSATGTATTFVTAIIAVSKLDNISHGYYRTNLYKCFIKKTAVAAYASILPYLTQKSTYTIDTKECQ